MSEHQVMQWAELCMAELVLFVIAGFAALHYRGKWINATRWVSVKNRLPESGELVLVTDGEMLGIETYPYNLAEQPQFDSPTTHWMHAPEPPEREP